MRPCRATPTSTFSPHRPCSPSRLSGAPSRSHGGLCHPEPSPGDRPEAPRGAPPRQLSWGGASGRGRGPSQVTGQAGSGGGGELQSRTKGSGDPRDGSGGGFQRVGPGEAAAPGCAPQRRKPGTAPSLCVRPRFGGTNAPLNPLRSKGEGEVCPRISDKNRLQWTIAPASSPAGRVSEVTEGTWRGRPWGGVPPWSGGLRVSDEDFSPLETPLCLRCPSCSLLPKQSVSLDWSFKARRRALDLSWEIDCIVLRAGFENLVPSPYSPPSPLSFC